MKTCVLTAIAGLAAAAAPSFGQSRFLINDRTNDSIWAVHDRNGNGVIDQPDEVSRFFSSANAAGTLAISNPTCLAVRADGLVLMGDQGNRCVYLVHDLNRDGNGQGLGESVVAADATNASAVSLAFPTGAAFDSLGRAYVVNAGNSFGNDAIYRLVDLDMDGQFQSTGEITEYVGAPAFGPGNGAFSPQEMAFDFSTSPLVGYMHDSASTTRGVYRFVDLNGNGRADDPGEFTTYFNATNASGLLLGAGFALTMDAARPGAMYILQTLTGPIRQLIRLKDGNGNNTAQDAGEAVVVWQTTESGFTEIAAVSLADGRGLITDNSGKRVIVLTDLDMDDKFTSAGERATYFANNPVVLGDLRQMYVIAPVCQPNCDESTIPPVLNVNDFICFQTRFAAGDPSANCDASTTTPVLNVNDFICFQTKFAAGCE